MSKAPIFYYIDVALAGKKKKKVIPLLLVACKENIGLYKEAKMVQLKHIHTSRQDLQLT